VAKAVAPIIEQEALQVMARSLCSRIALQHPAAPCTIIIIIVIGIITITADFPLLTHRTPTALQVMARSLCSRIALRHHAASPSIIVIGIIIITADFPLLAHRASTASQVNTALLSAISAGDYETYAALVAPDVTCFDRSETMGNLVEGTVRSYTGLVEVPL
jgi:hypothetical protein